MNALLIACGEDGIRSHRVPGNIVSASYFFFFSFFLVGPVACGSWQNRV